MGRESVVARIPTMSMSGGSAAPIENSPPGIHTMPRGAGAGAGRVFGTVGANAAPGLARELELARTEVVSGRRTTAQRMAEASEKNPRRQNFPNAAGLPRRTGFSAAFSLWFFSFNLIALPQCDSLH
jgi:hypothetical protein